MNKLHLRLITTLLTIAVACNLRAQVIPFSLAEEAASQNTPEGWKAVDLPSGLPAFTEANTFYINDARFGASETAADNTAAIQAALDAADKAGGGMVVVPEGTWMFGRIQMGSKTVLHLKAGATLKLLAYADQPDHTTKTPYIMGKSGASDVVIEGESRQTSVIEGQGADWWKAVEQKVSGLQRGSLIRFKQGKRYLFRNFRMQNTPGTNITIGESGNGAHATVHDVTIKNPASHDVPVLSHNTDGIPIWTQYVNIYNCEIDTGDDNVVADSKAQFVHVWNCQMKAGHGASLGSYTVDMHDIIYEDLTFEKTDCGFRLKSNRDRSGDVYNLVFRNCTMTNVASPIVITSWYDKLPASQAEAAAAPDELIATTPRYHDILLQNITASGYSGKKSNEKNYNGIMIYGRPESKVRNVVFDHVNISHLSGIRMSFCEGIEFINNCVYHRTSNNTTCTTTLDESKIVDTKYDCQYSWNERTTDGITPVSAASSSRQNASGRYTISGHKLNQASAFRGVSIHNGMKTISR